MGSILQVEIHHVKSDKLICSIDEVYKVAYMWTNGKNVLSFLQLEPETTILQLKNRVRAKCKLVANHLLYKSGDLCCAVQHLYPERQLFKISRDKSQSQTGSTVHAIRLSLSLEARPVKDEDTFRSLGMASGGVVYFKDLGE